jgi:hypothetical protein
LFRYSGGSILNGVYRSAGLTNPFSLPVPEYLLDSWMPACDGAGCIGEEHREIGELRDKDLVHLGVVSLGRNVVDLFSRMSKWSREDGSRQVTHTHVR